MTPRAFRWAVGVLSVALAVVVGANIVTRLDDDGGGFDHADLDDETVSVADAMVAPDDGLLAVRGFVFEDALGLRLCQLRQRDPIACIGPYVDLRGFDPASVPVRTLDRDGLTITYSRDAVTLIGRIDLATSTVFTVEEIAA